MIVEVESVAVLLFVRLLYGCATNLGPFDNEDNPGVLHSSLEAMSIRARQQLLLLTRYVLVGTLNALIGFGIFLVTIHFFRLDPLLGYGLTVLVWTGFGYRLQRILVFKTKPSRSANIKYFVSQFLSWGAGIAGMFVGVQILELSPELAYWANFTVWSIALFLYSRFGIFRQSGSGS